MSKTMPFVLVEFQGWGPSEEDVQRQPSCGLLGSPYRVLLKLNLSGTKVTALASLVTSS